MTFATVMVFNTANRAEAAGALLSQGKPATASSLQSAGYPASKAVDGSTGTRWSSASADPQWLMVDLGSPSVIDQVTLNWNHAAARAFEIQVSDTGSAPWTTIYRTTTGTGGVQTLPVNGTGQYVRTHGTARTTGYGYSLIEFQVFGVPVSGGGSTGTGGTGTALPTSNTPDFGPNVHIFDPSMSRDTIQATLNSVFDAQKANQFGNRRDALVFKPGNYGTINGTDGSNGVYANIGFNTSILGLGMTPDATTINGSVTVDAFNASEKGNATQNFWRSAENLAVNPIGGKERWGVSQAAPFRRMHVKGGLQLYPNGCGWSSGGYIADTKVDAVVESCSQQQFYSRDSTIGSWNGSNWNMVFSGVIGAPAQSFPSPRYTTLATTPVSREKPFLTIDGSGNYHVFVPSLRTNARGTSWAGGSTAGVSLPMTDFYVAKPGDAAAKLNGALAAGQNIFFTPGVYHLDQTLNVVKANQILLGIGYPTLVPDNGITAMTVADVDGVKVAGLLFDAGTTNSPSLLTVGPAKNSVSHAANPTTLQDVFFRIGGAVAGKATNSLIVNSNNVIVDHTWAWRADHGVSATGWTINTADNGVVVTGDNVLATGLFVEHYQKWNVLWNGNGGRTIFFQNELPYDVPNQASWNSAPMTSGYTAYKVADSVTTHEAWGLGAYIFTSTDPSIHLSHAFEVPVTSGVKMHDLVTVSLGNKGTIDHVINNAGAVTPTNSTPTWVTTYP